MFERFGLKIPEILLPGNDTDMRKWAVIACDQFTSQPDYWERVRAYVGDAPSTLALIYPEAWLGQGDARIDGINSAMIRYERQVLTRRVGGFILTERQVTGGTRWGLLAAVDLEQYDFGAASRSLIRPTEGTIADRIPPRVRIRRGAALELPHILLLADDPGRTLIEPLCARRDGYPLLYDFDLMENGGHIRGWQVTDPMSLTAPLDALLRNSDGLLFAVGDGNHSLATARQCWLDLKKNLTEEQAMSHPARCALVEINNIHDAGMAFEPIHRAVFGTDPDALKSGLEKWLKARDMDLIAAAPDAAMLTLISGGRRESLAISGLDGRLPLQPLQAFLDEFTSSAGARIDYIHGIAALEGLARDGCVGIALNTIDKGALFSAVRRGGSLPRKTFSLGEARDKRYYLECRKIV